MEEVAKQSFIAISALHRNRRIQEKKRMNEIESLNQKVKEVEEHLAFLNNRIEYYSNEEFKDLIERYESQKRYYTGSINVLESKKPVVPEEVIKTRIE